MSATIRIAGGITVGRRLGGSDISSPRRRGVGVLTLAAALALGAGPLTAGLQWHLDDPWFTADCWNHDVENICDSPEPLIPGCGRDSTILRVGGLSTTLDGPGAWTFFAIDAGPENPPLIQARLLVALAAATRKPLAAYEFAPEAKGRIAQVARGNWQEFAARAELETLPGVVVEVALCVETPRGIEERDLRAALGRLKLAVLNVSADGKESPLAVRTLDVSTDTDRDGIPDATDPCPGSDLSETVAVGRCRAQPNPLVLPGCTLADVLAPCDKLAPAERSRCQREAIEQLTAAGWLADDAAAKLLACFDSAPPPVPFNRFIKSVDVSPDTERRGYYRVHVESAVEVFESARVDRDLSWSVVMREASGKLVFSIPIPANVPAQDVGTCGGLGCPGPCGSGNARGQGVPMTCEDSDYVPDACSCQLICPGGWVGPLDGADDFTIELGPAPGSLPEVEIRDDLVRCSVSGPCGAPPEPTTWFADREHRALGGARFIKQADALTLSNIGSNGEDGVEVSFPPTDAFAIEFQALPGESGESVYLQIKLENVQVSTAHWESTAGGVRIEPGTFDLEEPTFEVWADGAEVGGPTSASPTVHALAMPTRVSLCVFRWCRDGGCYSLTYGFPAPTEVETGGKTLVASTIELRLREAGGATRGGGGALIEEFSAIRIFASGLSSFVILDEQTPVISDPKPRFVRGDANGGQGVDITDGIATLNFLFLGGQEPPCLDASDADDSGGLDLSDGVAVFSFLFLDGAPPPEPGPKECGVDPTADELTCASPTASCIEP